MTLSKERINTIWADGERAKDWEVEEMAAELLERRERDKQGPVAVCTVEDGAMRPDGFGECQHNLTDGTHELYAAPPAPVEPAAYEIIAEAWRLMDGQNPETSEWHTVASRYLNAYRTARATISNSADIAIDEGSQSLDNSEQLNSPVVPDGFRIVSLDALGAACGALQRHAPDCKTLKLLRRYTFGDLSKPNFSLAAAPKLESE